MRTRKYDGALCSWRFLWRQVGGSSRDTGFPIWRRSEWQMASGRTRGTASSRCCALRRDLDHLRPGDYRDALEFRHVAPVVAACGLGRGCRHRCMVALVAIETRQARTCRPARVGRCLLRGRARCHALPMGHLTCIVVLHTAPWQARISDLLASHGWLRISTGVYDVREKGTRRDG